MALLTILLTEDDRIHLKWLILFGLTASCITSGFIIMNGVMIRNAVSSDDQQEKQFHRLNDRDLLFSDFLIVLITCAAIVLIHHITTAGVLWYVIREPVLRRCRRHSLSLMSFLMTLLLVIEVLLIGLSVTCDSDIRSSHSEVVTDYLQSYIRHDDTTIVTMQLEHQCCGSDGPMDWITSKPDDEDESVCPIPLSCSYGNSSRCDGDVAGGQVYETGCAEVLSIWYRRHSLVLIILTVVLFLTDGIILIFLTYMQSSISTGVVVDDLIFPSYGFLTSERMDRKSLRAKTMATSFPSRSMATVSGQSVQKTLGHDEDQDVLVSVLDMAHKSWPDPEEPDITAPNKLSLHESRIQRTIGDNSEYQSIGLTDVRRVTELRQKDHRPQKYRIRYYHVREQE